MTPAKLIVIGCMLLAGCPKLNAIEPSDSAAGSSSAGECSPLDGVYRATYTQQSGSCGPQADELLEYRGGRAVPTATSNCQAGGEAMVSPCELKRDSQCALSDGFSGALLGYARVKGTLAETDGNKRLEGRLDVGITDNSGSSCESTYQVLLVKTR